MSASVYATLCPCYLFHYPHFVFPNLMDTAPGDSGAPGDPGVIILWFDLVFFHVQSLIYADHVNTGCHLTGL